MSKRRIDEELVSMPKSLDSERTLLGALILQPKRITETDRLGESDFWLEAHRIIYRAMREEMEERGDFDGITLNEWLVKRRLDVAVGGIAYISSLIDGVPHSMNFESHVDILIDHSRKRALINISNRAVAQLLDLDSTEEVLDTLQSALIPIINRDNRQSDVSITATVRAIYEQLWNIRNGKIECIGQPTGIGNLDSFLTGYRAGELTVIGAWPSHGKSAMMVQGANEAATHDVPVGCISLEMSREALLKRMVSLRAEIELQKFRDPRFLQAHELERIGEELAKLGKMPLMIEDRAGLTVRQLSSEVKLMIMRGAKIVYVDYLQRLGAEGQQDDKQKVASAALCLADLSKQYKIPIVALSQLARPDGRTPNTRPTMFYLKESGDCEAHADNVVLIYRPKDGEGVNSGEDELIVDKQREGPTGPLKVHFVGKYAKFRERDWTHDAPAAPIKKPKDRQLNFDAKGAAAGDEK